MDVFLQYFPPYDLVLNGFSHQQFATPQCFGSILPPTEIEDSPVLPGAGGYPFLTWLQHEAKALHTPI